MNPLTAYQIKKGDTLSEIAQRYNVTVDSILRANPKIKNRDLINEGDWIDVPVIKQRWEGFWGAIRSLFSR